MEPVTTRGRRPGNLPHRFLGSFARPALLFPVIAVLLLAVLWGSTLRLIRGERQAAERLASTETGQLLDTYEAQVVRALREIDHTLRLVELQLGKAGSRGSLSVLEEKGLLPPSLLFTIVVADRDGKVVQTNRPNDGDSGSVVTEPYFVAARESNGFSVGLPTADPETGEWLLRFSRPLRDDAGTFSGVVTLVADASYFVSGYEPARLGRHGVLGILGTDGVFRAWRTGETVSAGERVGHLPALADEGTVLVLRNSWDGVVRYICARRLYAFPLAVVVGLAVDEALAPAVEVAGVYRLRAVVASLLIVGVLTILGWLTSMIQRLRLEDLQERVEHAERLQFLADHDGLTGLPNRSLFGRLVEQALREATRYHRLLAVVFIDLDRFKQINDTLGHDAGDDLLGETASRLRSCLRESDSVARMGGDEFIVLLPEIAAVHSPATVAEKILAELSLPFVLLGQEYRITCSIGISVFPADGLDVETLSKNADVAMYEAKGEGKNTFRFYSEEMRTESLERLALESSLQKALETGEFRLDYQAKRDARSGRVTGVEALLRWQHPDWDTVSPMRFLAIAEETGLIVPIGRWALKTACHQVVAWQRQGLPRLRVSVNLSSRQFQDEDLVRDVRSALEDAGMDSDLLELEISEALVMHDVPGTQRILQELKGLGVRIALDNFGVGYSGLARLERFPLDSIKIDRSFIHHVSDTPAGLTDGVVALGRSMGLTVVGQGVETDEQAAFLRRHGCDELQGFHVHRPMPPEELADLLRSGADLPPLRPTPPTVAGRVAGEPDAM